MARIPLSYRANECCRVGDQETNLILLDSTGAEDYKSLVGTMLSEADIVIICFLLPSEPERNGNIEKWQDAVKRYCPHARCLLAGIMAPGGETDAKGYIKTGKKAAADFGIPWYVQCNLEKGPSSGGVDDLLETVGSPAIQTMYIFRITLTIGGEQAAKAAILGDAPTQRFSTYGRFRFPWRAAARSRLSSISEIPDDSWVW